SVRVARSRDTLTRGIFPSLDYARGERSRLGDIIVDHFHLRDGELSAEDVPLARIAEEVGTPVYVYSRATLERHARVFSAGLADLRDPWIAYSLKSNPNLSVVKVLQRQGFGADVVSGGE